MAELTGKKHPNKEILTSGKNCTKNYQLAANTIVLIIVLADVDH